MATNTTNYKLKKPAQEDYYNIDDHNGNMDIIDKELKKQADKDAGLESKISQNQTDLTEKIENLKKKDQELEDTKVSKSGDTMTGALTVNADVTAQNITATGRIEGDTVNAKHYELNNDPLVDSTGWADDYGSTLYVTTSKGGLMTPTDKSKLDALVSGTLTYEKVDKLPETSAAKKNTVYLVKRNGNGENQDACDEYLYDGTSFELIGSSKVDLTDYAKKTDLESKADKTELAKKADQSALGALQSTVQNKADKSTVDTIQNDYLSRSKGGWVVSGVGIGKNGEGLDPFGERAFINGNECTASGAYAHAEGQFCHADGLCSHAEGGIAYNSTGSHAEGEGSHAEGTSTAQGSRSHAEGAGCVAQGPFSHAEGSNTTTYKNGDHTEGVQTSAAGGGSHTEGFYTKTDSSYSHAEGYHTKTNFKTTFIGDYVGEEIGGLGAHVAGAYTESTEMFQNVVGKYNKDLFEENGLKLEGSNGTLFIVGCGTGEKARDNALWVTADGTIHSKSALSTGGADYAEYFEWLDGNTDGEDRRGLFVTLDGDKVKIANSTDDFILGVVSGAPTVIGNSYDCTWKDMYLKDVYGNRITQEVTEEAHDDEDGTHHEARTYTTWVVNPEYDSEQEYIPREKRNEWVAIGMLGVLTVNDDGSCEVNGYCKVADGGTATKSDTGYRVLKRLDDTHVRILLK